MNETGLDKKQWSEKLEQLGLELENRGIHAEIVALGSVPNILTGQPGRTTLDLDVWKPASSYPEKALRDAAEAAGLLYDPQEVLEPDKPYLQIIRPGIVQLGSFKATQVENFEGLALKQPPVENLIASKLCRASEKDIEDIAWLMGKHQPDRKRIVAIINTFPIQQRQTATENLVYLRVITPIAHPTTRQPTKLARKAKKRSPRAKSKPKRESGEQGQTI